MAGSNRKRLSDLSRRQKRRRLQSIIKKYHSYKRSASPIKRVEQFPVVCESPITLVPPEENFSVPIEEGQLAIEQNYLDVNELESDLPDFPTELKHWFYKHKPTQASTTDLLKVLRRHPCHQNLPQASRTFLSTPSSMPIRAVAPGHYCHFGLEKGLDEYLCGTNTKDTSLSLKFNVDGLPLFKSSSTELWPILCNIMDTTHIFPVGIYCGKGKPQDVNQFLSEFVVELNEVLKTGIVCEGRSFVVSVHSFVCDAPARAYITCIKGHTAFYGCGKCTVKGKRRESRLVYSKLSSPLRTDASFRSREQAKHHNDLSILEDLPIDMVKQFPFEYMHLVCLGVVRKLILLWTKAKPAHYKLSPKEVAILSERHCDLAEHMQREFMRKPRSFIEIDRWKATELRTFLLYTGPVVLRKTLKKEIYDHFMCLSVAIRILATPDQTTDKIDYAGKLLLYFVEKFKQIYSITFVSYNVHGLIHLADDVRQFGPLDSFSAFCFENYLGQLKRLVVSATKPLQQLHRRLSERSSIFQTDGNFTIKSVKASSRLDEVHGVIFSKISVQSYTLEENSYFLDKQWNVYRMVGAAGNTIFANQLCNVKDFFKIPIESKQFGIFKVSNRNHSSLPIVKVQVELFFTKCVALPYKDKLVVIPMIIKE